MRKIRHSSLRNADKFDCKCIENYGQKTAKNGGNAWLQQVIEVSPA